MISSNQLTQIKQVAITAYLQHIGCNPVKSVGNELVYYSPKYEETTPSFFVNPIKNVFHDFGGSGEKGDLIRLVQYLDSCSFLTAINALETFSRLNVSPSFSFSGQSSSKVEQPALKITHIQPIQNRALVNYLSSRKVSLTVAGTCLQEIHYRAKGKLYYALGFRNDKGGFELRSKHFKGCTSPKWITSLNGQANEAVNVFEGVYDYLSCCEFFHVSKLKNPTLILNSLSFLKDALPTITSYSHVNVFFDNDKAGRQAVERIQQIGLNIRDCSTYYLTSKDFNEHFVKHYTLQHL